MTLIFAKFDADLINISKVTSRKTKWPRFFLAYPVYFLFCGSVRSSHQTISILVSVSFKLRKKIISILPSAAVLSIVTVALLCL